MTNQGFIEINGIGGRRKTIQVCWLCLKLNDLESCREDQNCESRLKVGNRSRLTSRLHQSVIGEINMDLNGVYGEDLKMGSRLLDKHG